MTLIAVLLLLGSALVFLETVLVGGVWCVAGLACYAYAAWETYSLYGGVAALGVACLAVVMCAASFAVWLYVIPKTKTGKKFYLDSAEDGRAPAPDRSNLADKEGVALTALMPTGKVEIDGAIYDASGDFTHISKGDRIKVVSADAFAVKVRKI